jgi:hypothetical protein
VNVIESSLITRKPNIIDKIDQSNYDNDFALWRPSPITKLPYIIHGVELQSQIQATGKPRLNVDSKWTFKEDVEGGFNMMRAEITHRWNGTTSHQLEDSHALISKPK